MDNRLFTELQQVSHSMFSKNYFGVFHGSISAKIDINAFVINRKNIILDEVHKDAFIRLMTNTKKDYRWKEASLDTDIHLEIYNSIPNAKYISYTMPPYATAYSFEHSRIIPQDFYGYESLREVAIYDPGNFNDWAKRAPHEIANYFEKHNSHLLLVKGFGLVSYNRDLLDMVKQVAILENSCRLLTINNMNR